MPIAYSTPSVDDLEELNELDGRAFGYVATSEQIESSRDVLELDRFVVARDGDTMVACGGNFSLELTLPGPATIPMAGVTWIAVAATHRRQGIASEIMGRLTQDAKNHNEPLSGLAASEGGIYERFGYGRATVSRNTTIDRRQVQLAPRFKPAPGSVRLGDPIKEVEVLAERFDRWRRSSVGEVSRSPKLFEHNTRGDKANPNVAAIHEDGYAVWTLTPDWNEGDPQHRVQLLDFVAITEEAYLALWDLLLSIDLAGEISSRWSSPDEPLPYFLDNPRRLKTSQLGDHLWLKVLDPEAALAARSYRTIDQFVLELSDGTQLAVDQDEARPVVGLTPDITITDSALGPLLLGGVAATSLAVGHRLTASAGVLGRADAFFGVSPAPHCSSEF